MNYENKLYKNKVTILYEDRRHRYVWEEQDREVKSVTTVLRVINKPALVPWAANAAVDCIVDLIKPGNSYDELELADIWDQGRASHHKRKKDAGDLGTLLHKWIEDYIKGNDPGMPVNTRLQKSVNKFLKWVEDHHVKFLLSEQVIFSKTYVYCGTLDFICEVDGKMYIGDLKTSTGIYPEMLIQVAGYRFAREEEYPDEKYCGMLILRIGSDGTFETAVVRAKKTYCTLMSAFIYALGLSNALDEVEAYRPDKNI